MFNLGLIIKDGRSTGKDDITAARWKFKTTKEGSAFARTQMHQNTAAFNPTIRRELQRLMKEEGIYGGPMHGNFDTNTQRAIELLGKK